MVRADDPAEHRRELLDDVKRSIRSRTWPVHFAITGLLLLGYGCSSNGGGETGTGGHAGGAGAAGTQGAAGTSGVAGAAGAGMAGMAGTTGAAGTGGDAGGATGAAGTIGSAGQGGGAGTAAAAGSGGAAGAAGVAGTAGAGGRGGAAGGRGGTGVGGQSGVAGSSAGQGGGGVGGRGGGVGGGGGLSTGSGGGLQDGGSLDGARDGSGDGGTAYMPCPTTAGTACAVLPLGDSITEGCCTAPMGGYRIELFRQAVTNGKNVTFVGTLLNGPTTVANRTFPMRHEGHGGYTIAGGGNGPIAGSVTDTAISTYHPNIVLLMIGTNDINGNINVSTAPTRLGQLIDEIITDAPAALVVVATIIPISAPGGDQRTQTFNAAIPGLVNTRAQAGKHVVLVDNYAAFAKDPNYQTTLKADGLHPNDAGYVILGQSFYGAIGALLPAGP